MPASAEGSWEPGPATPLLADGGVHVWRADLEAVTNEECLVLCDDERARAERFVRERDRLLWRRSRAVLRALLARYLHEEAGGLRFATGTHGKPALLGDSGGASERPQTQSATPGKISFNLSHSGELALYAVSPTLAVGVDVETPRRRIDMLAIAARTFGPAEAARLEGLDAATREREFLRAWVRHEAELKCSGIGFAGAETLTGARRPWVADLELGRPGAAAVAVEAPPRELRLWDWPDPGHAGSA